ncbi:MAG: hypothetical protein KKF44_03710 [Nanoarchaeota archaeon]|nr:hypothetical protein [Nanoarchaeota archaeon]
MDFKERREYVELVELLEKIQSKYGLSNFEILSHVEKKEYYPVSGFLRELSPLENIVKFLKEEKGYSYVVIGKKLKRSEKTIWQAYQNSRKKVPDKITVTDSNYMVPLDFLSDRKYTIFELIVKFMIKNYSLKYSETANILHRDDRTIWTVYSRAMKKMRTHEK